MPSQTEPVIASLYARSVSGIAREETRGAPPIGLGPVTTWAGSDRPFLLTPQRKKQSATASSELLCASLSARAQWRH